MKPTVRSYIEPDTNMLKISVSRRVRSGRKVEREDTPILRGWKWVSSTENNPGV